MDVKEAVVNAKKHVLDVMSDESIEPPTLEEVWFDKRKSVWRVTLGIRRVAAADSAAGRLGLRSIPDYKTVTLSDDGGKIISLKDRLLQGTE